MNRNTIAKETTGSGSMPAFKPGPVKLNPSKADLKKAVIAGLEALGEPVPSDLLKGGN